MTRNYGTPSDDGSPADDYFPRIIPEDDGIQDDTVLDEPVESPLLDRISETTGKIVAGVLIISATAGITIICLGSIWWLLKKFF